ncbi:unnamed protein product [Staurois parvus]|uniref:Uncharacterized protein n=1 Tax=Staurois parvus TaxID=386267 RepID=A0ABN9CPH3_9NEOB|nr:unnamed protein product [Staurois parvus]
MTGARSHFHGVVLPLVWAPGWRFVNGPASSGTCHVSQKTPAHSQSAAQWAPGCHSWVPTLKMPTQEDITALDRGTGKVLLQRRAERPARYSDTVAAAEIPDRPLHSRSIRRTDIFPPFLGGKSASYGAKKCGISFFSHI